MILLSLDVSSVSTGWSIFDNIDLIDCGTITFDNGTTLHNRLVLFRDKLYTILEKYTPDVVLIEDVWWGKNAVTSKILAKFCGVAEESVTRFTHKPPNIIVNKTIKGFFKCLTKKDLYKFIIDIMELDAIFNSYERYNDITDSLSMGLYYIHNNIKEIKEIKDYGCLFVYERKDLCLENLQKVVK